MWRVLCMFGVFDSVLILYTVLICFVKMYLSIQSTREFFSGLGSFLLEFK